VQLFVTLERENYISYKLYLLHLKGNQVLAVNWLDIVNFFRPGFDWIQVEVSSQCNAACVYCPRTVYRDQWASRLLSLKTFEKLTPIFSRTRLVYLQGWGEPFLHPDFFAMADLARKAGCRVGVTTNGALLDRDRLIRIVEAELDVVAFSLAGTDEAQDAVRRGTHLKQVLEAIHGLQEEKARRGAQKPQINLAYMLLRSGLGSISPLPPLLKSLGVRQAVISTLDFVAAQDLERETLRPQSQEEYREIISRLQEVVQAGAAGGQEIQYHLRPPGEKGGGCRENVSRALVVAADGRVAPCVYSNLPVSGVTYLSQGRELPYRSLSFGNIKDTPLTDIWRDPEYSRFRASFQKGAPAAPCRRCDKR